MGFKEVMANVMDKIKEKIENEKARRAEEDELPDEVTRDRYLRSLRRQRRIQLEEIEKKELKEKIAKFDKEKLRKDFFDIKDNSEKQKGLIRAINRKKEINMLKNGKNMLRKGIRKKMGKVKTIRNGYGWLHKGNL